MAKIDITKTVKNFGKIKNAYNEILVESVVTKNNDKKGLFKNYVKTVKENEILKNQFLVYNLIENKVEPNETKAKTFIDECLNVLSKYNTSEIVKANKTLVENIVWEFDGDYDKKELHENISILICTSKTPKTIDAIVEAKTYVLNYITNNILKENNEGYGLPNSLVSKIMVEKYNDKYSKLDESEKNVLKALIDSDDNKKKEVYSNAISECLTLINEKLKESDIETKEKLLMVKERLLNDEQVVNEDYFKNISRLIDLRSSLKNK
jgi:hypothetical protein